MRSRLLLLLLLSVLHIGHGALLCVLPQRRCAPMPPLERYHSIEQLAQAGFERAAVPSGSLWALLDQSGAQVRHITELGPDQPLSLIRLDQQHSKHVRQARMLTKQSRLDSALEALGVFSGSGAGPKLPEAEDGDAPLTPGLFYQLPAARVAGLEKAWETFLQLVQSFGKSPVQDMHSMHSSVMRRHWYRSHRAPDEELYTAREAMVREDQYLDLLRLSLTAGPYPRGSAAQRCDYGNLVESCVDLQTQPWSGPRKHSNLTDLGVAAERTDVRIAFGGGWEMMNGKMQLSTASIAAKSVLTCTDTTGTEHADEKLNLLLSQVAGVFGAKHVAGGRGIYLYPPGGFHE